MSVPTPSCGALTDTLSVLLGKEMTAREGTLCIPKGTTWLPSAGGRMEPSVRCCGAGPGSKKRGGTMGCVSLLLLFWLGGRERRGLRSRRKKQKGVLGGAKKRREGKRNRSRPFSGTPYRSAITLATPQAKSTRSERGL